MGRRTGPHSVHNATFPIALYMVGIRLHWSTRPTMRQFPSDPICAISSGSVVALQNLEKLSIF